MAQDRSRFFFRPFPNNVILNSLVVFVFIVIAALSITEIVLRAVGPRNERPEANNSLNTFDPELGWFHKPNLVAVPHVTSNRTTLVRTNGIGLRERDLRDIAPDRILFLGDSFTFGFDAEEGERFTNLLQNEQPQYGMVNAGVSGYGTDQQLLLMNRLWRAVKPKIVVLTFCVDNDRDDNSISLHYGKVAKPYFVRAPEGALHVRGYPLPDPQHPDTHDNFLSKNLALLRFAIQLRAGLRERAIFVPDPTEHLIGLMRQGVEARGARFFVGLQRHEPRLEGYLRSQNIPYTTFEDAPAYPMAGNHWTPEGNAVVARKYLALFRAEGTDSGRAGPNPVGLPEPSTRDRASPQPLAATSAESARPASVKAFFTELAELARFLKFWAISVHDNRGDRQVIIAVVVLILLSVGVLILIFAWRRRFKATDLEQRPFAKALHSLGVFLIIALPVPLATLVLLEATTVRMIAIEYGIIACLSIYALGRAVAHGVFAPDNSQRRMFALSDTAARSLARYLTWGNRGVALLVVILSIHTALAAPQSLTTATHALFAGFICFLLLHFMWTWPSDAISPSWMFIGGSVALTMIAVAFVAGSPAMGSFIGVRLVSIVTVAALAFLLTPIVKELFTQRLAFDDPRSLAIAADLGTTERWLDLAIIAAILGIVLAVLLACFVIYLGPW